MTGKMVLVMKKWWLTVLVFTCAISLTSCSKKKSTELLQDGPGTTQCSGSMGDFDIYVYQSQKSSDMFDVYVVPYQLSAAGDIATITVANSTGSYKRMVPEVVLQPNQQIYVGQLTSTEVDTYDLIDITSFDATTNYAQANPEKYTTCRYNISGDGSTPQ